MFSSGLVDPGKDVGSDANKDFVDGVSSVGYDVGRRSMGGRDQVQDSSKVLSTGWKPSFTLEEGIERTLEYEFLRDNCNDPEEVFYTE